MLIEKKCWFIYCQHSCCQNTQFCRQLMHGEPLIYWLIMQVSNRYILINCNFINFLSLIVFPWFQELQGMAWWWEWKNPSGRRLLIWISPVYFSAHRYLSSVFYFGIGMNLNWISLVADYSCMLLAGSIQNYDEKEKGNSNC